MTRKTLTTLLMTTITTLTTLLGCWFAMPTTSPTQKTLPPIPTAEPGPDPCPDPSPDTETEEERSKRALAEVAHALSQRLTQVERRLDILESATAATAASPLPSPST